VLTEQQIETQIFEEVDAPESASTQAQILRIKELRQQKRKLEGSDYIPFDESTSGGVFAKDQIHAANNNMNTYEAQLLKT
jgi:hypothetical protein